MFIFKDDEAGYARWLLQNPHGFVFNHFGGAGRPDNVLHRASCVFLRRPSDEGRRTVVEKRVSNDIVWLVEHLDSLRSSAGGWKICSFCCPF